jgi:predicted DNA-binding WGR domain protein
MSTMASRSLNRYRLCLASRPHSTQRHSTGSRDRLACRSRSSLRYTKAQEDGQQESEEAHTDQGFEIEEDPRKQRSCSLTRGRESIWIPARFSNYRDRTNKKENTLSTLAVSPTTVAISLCFREGSSDKVYQAQIAPDGNDLYSVNFQYGRRGSTLQTGTKTTAPVALVQAQKIFDKLVAEKRAKGYTDGESGIPYSGGKLASHRFEYTPQVLNFIDATAMLEYLRHPDWLMQEKMDGVRQIVVRRGDSVTAGSRFAWSTCRPPYSLRQRK